MGFNRFLIMTMHEISGVPSRFVEWSLLRLFGKCLTIWVRCSFPTTHQQQMKKTLKRQWWIDLHGFEPTLGTKNSQWFFLTKGNKHKNACGDLSTSAMLFTQRRTMSNSFHLDVFQDVSFCRVSCLIRVFCKSCSNIHRFPNHIVQETPDKAEGGMNLLSKLKAETEAGSFKNVMILRTVMAKPAQLVSLPCKCLCAFYMHVNFFLLWDASFLFHFQVPGCVDSCFSVILIRWPH